MERLRFVVAASRLKRSLSAVEPSPKLNFWRLIYGTLLDISVLEWCKVFGVDSEPTHWKSLVEDESAFRTTLLASLKIQDATWHKYWEEMKEYRDNHIAHHATEMTSKSYPNLDLAIASSCFYYGILVDELKRRGDKGLPDSLSEYGDRFAVQADKVATLALGATSGIDETVL